MIESIHLHISGEYQLAWATRVFLCIIIIMKQRLAIRIIISRGRKVLLLRRATGPSELIGKYELPGGRIRKNEQPEDTIRRILRVHVGIDVKATSLVDAMSYNDSISGDQVIFIVYKATISRSEKVAVSNGKYNHYAWKKISNLENNSLSTSVTNMLLLNSHRDTSYNVDIKATKNENTYVLYSDGGSRGNPGPSAAGYILLNPDGGVVFEGGDYLGVTTNNQAEYAALRLGLERAAKLNISNIECRIDSMLVVNQLKGIYSIKNRDLWPQFEAINSLAQNFNTINFVHVHREFNSLADGIVNKTLDANR